MKRLLVSMLMLTALTSCVSMFYWTKAGITKESYAKDNNECWNKGEKAAANESRKHIYSQIDLIGEIYRTCMLAKGNRYREQPASLYTCRPHQKWLYYA